MNNYLEEKIKELRYTDEEVALLKATFGGNDKLLKLLRKVFAPSYDPQAPLHKTTDIMWVGLEQLAQMAPGDRELILMSQIRLNRHLENCLLDLSVLVNTTEASPEQMKAKEVKNSGK